MREMNLRLTLMDSAQAFHWRKIGGVFAAVVDGRVLTSADEDAFARAYFDDARDYSRLMEDCAAYPVAARAVQATPGLRVLNQPPRDNRLDRLEFRRRVKVRVVRPIGVDAAVVVIPGHCGSHPF